MMQRTDLQDTSEWAHQAMVKLLRDLTPEQRFKMVLERSELGRQIHQLAVQRVAEARKQYDSLD